MNGAQMNGKLFKSVAFFFVSFVHIKQAMNDLFFFLVKLPTIFAN